MQQPPPAQMETSEDSHSFFENLGSQSRNNNDRPKMT